MKFIIEYLKLFGALIATPFVLAFLLFLMFIDWIRGK